MRAWDDDDLEQREREHGHGDSRAVGDAAQPEFAEATLGVQLVPLRALGAAEIPARLAIATSPFDTPPTGTLLYLGEIPSGTYRIQVTRSRWPADS
jgi:hypothetical protein